MTRIGKLALVNRLNLLVAGLQKHLGTGSLLVANTSHSTAELAPSFTSLVMAIQATASAKASYQAAVQTEAELTEQLLPLVSGVREALYVMYRGSVETLADFGIAPHKVPVISPEARVAAIAKAEATRAARHTMSKKQKAAIHGSVSAPVAAPAAPAVAPAETGTPKATG